MKFVALALMAAGLICFAITVKMDHDDPRQTASGWRLFLGLYRTNQQGWRSWVGPGLFTLGFYLLIQ